MTSWGRTEEQQRWFADAEQREDERRAAKRELRRNEERNTVAALRSEMQAELASLRAEMTAQKQLLLDATGQALGEISSKTLDLAERTIRDLQRELTTSISRNYGELLGRLDALAPGTRERSTKDFKFSNERDDGIIDMPNPIVRKTTFN
jgi:hypothetical protein